MKNKQLSEIDLINLWMVKYHGITIEKAYEQNKWTNSFEFYSRYTCTQQQHDEWEKEARYICRKHFNWNNHMEARQWVFIYLNTSPQVK